MTWSADAQFVRTAPVGDTTRSITLEGYAAERQTLQNLVEANIGVRPFKCSQIYGSMQACLMHFIQPRTP